MGTVFELSRKKVFTLKEALEILPVIKRITDEASNVVTKTLALLEAVRNQDLEKAKDLEAKVSKTVSDWQTKIEKIGAEGKGLWLVDFDCGVGYYCWKFPEDNLSHFHGYTEGFQARKKISDSIGNITIQPEA